MVISCWNSLVSTQSTVMATHVYTSSRSRGSSSPQQLLVSYTKPQSPSSYISGKILYTFLSSSSPVAASSQPPSPTVVSGGGLVTGGVCWHAAVYGGVAGGVVGAVIVGTVVLVLNTTMSWRKRCRGYTCTPSFAGSYVSC